MKLFAKMMTILFVVALTNCNDNHDPKLVALVDAENRWAAFAGHGSYTMTLVKDCYCLDAHQQILAIVRDDRVISAMTKGGPFPPERVPTIRQLFDWARDSERRVTDGETTVSYHPTQGWPTTFRYATKAMHASIDIHVQSVALDAPRQGAAVDALKWRSFER